MIFLALIQVVAAPPDDVAQLLHDALANHGWIVAGVCAVLLIAPMVLKAFNVNVPFLDTILGVLVKILRDVETKQEAAKAKANAEAPGIAAVGNVVGIDELANKDKKNAGV